MKDITGAAETESDEFFPWKPEESGPRDDRWAIELIAQLTALIESLKTQIKE